MTGLVRTITHWTGGGYRANAKDKRHYHLLTEFDGNQVRGKEDPEDNIVTSDDDYAAHTLNLNSGSIGTAMCGMMGAQEYPLDYGDFPITEKQFERHCMMLAEVHANYAIPVNEFTCITHAEVEPRLGVKQRNKWDLTVLPFKEDIRGAYAVGDYMRKRVTYYLNNLAGLPTQVTRKRDTLRKGDRGRDVEDLQVLLKELGFHLGEVDGRFGPVTDRAVVLFQRANGLTPDGIVGDRTWAALQGKPKGAEIVRQHVSTKSLREAGSREIRAADSVQTASALQVAGGAGSLGAIGTLSAELRVAKDGLEEVGATVGAEGPIGEMLPYIAGLIVLALAGLAVWQFVSARKAKQARLERAQTGADLSL